MTVILGRPQAPSGGNDNRKRFIRKSGEQEPNIMEYSKRFFNFRPIIFKILVKSVFSGIFHPLSLQ